MTPDKFCQEFEALFPTVMEDNLPEGYRDAYEHQQRIFSIVSDGVDCDDHKLKSKRFLIVMYYMFTMIRQCHRQLIGGLNVVVPASLYYEFEIWAKLISAHERYASGRAMSIEAGWLAQERIESWSSREPTVLRRESPLLTVVTDIDEVLTNGLLMRALVDHIGTLNMKEAGAIYLSNRPMDEYCTISHNGIEYDFESLGVEAVLDIKHICEDMINE